MNYWEMNVNYKKMPKNVSQKLIQQNNKYWSKNDEVLLSDYNGVTPPIDTFKKEYYAQSKKNEVSEKALTKNYINPGSLPKKKF